MNFDKQEQSFTSFYAKRKNASLGLKIFIIKIYFINLIIALSVEILIINIVNKLIFSFAFIKYLFSTQ